jgi:enolase
MDYNHKRILRIRLLMIESDLRDIISKLVSDTNTSNFILYSVKNTIDSERKQKILTAIDSMLNEISQIKEEFSLESEEQSIRQKILGQLNEIWTTLLDTRPESLVGYDSLSDSDAQLLNQLTKKLISMTDEIYKVLEQPH